MLDVGAAASLPLPEPVIELSYCLVSLGDWFGSSRIVDVGARTAGGDRVCIHITALCSPLVVGIACIVVGLARDQFSPLVVLYFLLYSPHCFVTGLGKAHAQLLTDATFHRYLS